MENFNEYEDPGNWNKPIKQRVIDLEKLQVHQKSKVQNKNVRQGYSCVSEKIDSANTYEGKTNYHGPHVSYIRKFGE